MKNILAGLRYWSVGGYFFIVRWYLTLNSIKIASSKGKNKLAK
jgi:hypothetical protein